MREMDSLRPPCYGGAGKMEARGFEDMDKIGVSAGRGSGQDREQCVCVCGSRFGRSLDAAVHRRYEFE